VWHHPDGRLVKIKRRDFGLSWPPEENEPFILRYGQQIHRPWPPLSDAGTGQNALRRGHVVTFASDRLSLHPAPDASVPAGSGDSPGDYEAAILMTRPDWVVVDLPEFPAWVSGAAGGNGTRLCLIDGWGIRTGILRPLYQPGPGGGVLRPRVLLLRPEVFSADLAAAGQDVCIRRFGRSYGLLPAYHRACIDQSAYLVTTEFCGSPTRLVQSRSIKHHIQLPPAGPGT